MKPLIYLNRAREFILDHALEPVTTANLADVAGYSPDHFHRLFVNTFGETPHAMITRRRIREAERMLASGDFSVSDVCLEVGFSSLASFSHLFERETGYRPREFKRVFSSGDLWTRKQIPVCFYRFSHFSTNSH